MEYDDKVKNRLKRIEGQIKGILKMMEDEKDCKDVVTQLSAVKSAIDRTSALVVSKNLEACIRQADSNDNAEEFINEAVNLLVKSR